MTLRKSGFDKIGKEKEHLFRFNSDIISEVREVVYSSISLRYGHSRMNDRKDTIYIYGTIDNSTRDYLESYGRIEY